ncbi:uncharacterized protein LOC143026780 [Oratosquilla oratoria]|uniref:uncharacterized protein LOC143026780 n=1 Tax=Oratosquilla oratoria TaxID=337810 RepID=UPI003F75ABCA
MPPPVAYPETRARSGSLQYILTFTEDREPRLVRNVATAASAAAVAMASETTQSNKVFTEDELKNWSFGFLEFLKSGQYLGQEIALKENNVFNIYNLLYVPERRVALTEAPTATQVLEWLKKEGMASENAAGTIKFTVPE